MKKKSKSSEFDIFLLFFLELCTLCCYDLAAAAAADDDDVIIYNAIIPLANVLYLRIHTLTKKTHSKRTE